MTAIDYRTRFAGDETTLGIPTFLSDQVLALVAATTSPS
jgi:hypothetical protein